jgi:hypothetical protein
MHLNLIVMYYFSITSNTKEKATCYNLSSMLASVGIQVVGFFAMIYAVILLFSNICSLKFVVSKLLVISV